MNCENCQHEVNSFASLNDQEGPKDGDFNICLYCGDVTVFENTMLRELNDSDLDNLEPGFLLELQCHQTMLRLFREKSH